MLRNITASAYSFIILIILSGCENPRVNQQFLGGTNAGIYSGAPKHDVDKMLSKQDYREVIAPASPGQVKGPVKKKITSSQGEQTLWPDKKVTLVVAPNDVLQDVLVSMAKQAKLGIQFKTFPPQKGFVFQAYDQPFGAVVEAVCTMGNLRCTLTKGGVLIEPDTPYFATYDLNFLATSREDKGSIAISTDIFSRSFGRTSAGGKENGSQSKLSTQTTIDFWSEIAVVLDTILPRRRMDSVTHHRYDDQPREVGGSLGKGAPAIPSIHKDREGRFDHESLYYPPPPEDKDHQRDNPHRRPRVGYAPFSDLRSDVYAYHDEGAMHQANEMEGGPGGGPLRTSSPGPLGVASYAIHKQAGLLTIHGTSQQHKLVKDYLTRLKRRITAQVLIEAKVLEVRLHDQFKTGINWRAIAGDFNFAAPLMDSAIQVASPPYTTLSVATQNMGAMGVVNQKFGALLQMIEHFGTVRTLSNPRLTVINNQPAVLKVAENKVYFQVKYEQRFITNQNGEVSLSNTFATESSIHTIPIGFVMSVHPSIDLDTDEVILTLRPSITKSSTSVTDPAVSIADKSVVSSIPVVEVREMDSVLKLQSGQIAVLGGLMQENVQNSETGLPGLGDIPLLGNLFKAKVDDREVTELVIFLQATIIEDAEPIVAVTPADKQLYSTYAQDPRPLNFDDQLSGAPGDGGTSNTSRNNSTKGDF